MEEFLKTYIPLALSVIVLGGHLTGWFSAAGKKAASDLDAFKAKSGDKIEEIERDLAAHDRRIQKLEDALIHLPTTVDFHRIELAMTELVGTVKVLTQKVDTNESVVTRVDAYLRESGK